MVDSRIDDSPCIDEHHDNKHNSVASVPTPDVVDITSPLTLSPDSSHNHGLSNPVSIRNKKEVSIKIKQRQLLPLIYYANAINRGRLFL